VCASLKRRGACGADGRDGQGDGKAGCCYCREGATAGEFLLKTDKIHAKATGNVPGAKLPEA